MLVRLLLMSSVALPASCCSCGPRRPACEVKWRYTAIFLGTVLDHARNGTATTAQTAHLVRIDEAFHGLPDGKKEIFFTSPTNDMCAADFKTGQQYLFFATGDGTNRLRFAPHSLERRWQTKDHVPVYFTSQCEPNQLAEQATEDLAWLRASSRGEQKARVFGRVVQNRASGSVVVPVHGARVFLSGPGGSLEQTSSADGSFLFDGLPSGDYLLRGELPPWVPSADTTLRVERGACAYSPMILRSNGEISGIAIDDRGQPVSGVGIRLNPVFNGKKSDSAWDAERTGADGRFHFVGVPASVYLLDFAVPYGSGVVLGGLPPLELGVHQRVRDVTIRVPDPLR